MPNAGAAQATTAAHPAAPGRLERIGVLAAAFLSGWGVMAIEIAAGRMLTPLFGGSIYQWGALIGTILAAMAGGYLAAGRIAARWGGRNFLIGGLVLAAIWTALLPAAGPTVLAAAREAGTMVGAVVAAALLFATPAVVLAAVSPIAVGLAAGAAAGSGQGRGVTEAAGRVSGAATLGSIAGTFAASFALIPWLGVAATYRATAVVLCLPPLLLILARRDWGAVPTALMPLLLTAIPAFDLPLLGVVHAEESPHNTIVVTEDATTRRLYLNTFEAVQTIMPRDGLLTGYYYDVFAALPALTGGRRVLFLGVGGGTTLRQLAEVWPEADLTGVELDPAVLAVARRYFGVTEGPHLRLIAEDARRFVETDAGQYDLIAVDVFRGRQVPFQCATREFFAAVARRLAPGGVVAMNVLPRRQDIALVEALAATARSVFGRVMMGQRGRNYFLLATDGPLDRQAVRAALEALDVPALATVAKDFADSLEDAPDTGRAPMTDDRSDIELLTQ